LWGDLLAARRWALRLWRFAFALCFPSILYLALRSDPAIASAPLFPDLVSGWFDLHDISKHVIGFGALSLTGFRGWWSEASLAVQVQLPRRGAVCWPCGKLALFLLNLVPSLEIAQSMIPLRSCDWKDVCSAWLGIVLAWLAVRRLDSRCGCGTGAAR